MKALRITAMALTLTGVAATAHAGGLDDPIIEAPVIEAATGSSNHDVLVPIMALILIGVAVSAAD